MLRPFAQTGLGRALAFLKEYWTIIVSMIIVAGWMQTQYILDVDTRDKVAALPAATFSLIECHQHTPEGVILLPCAMPEHRADTSHLSLPGLSIATAEAAD